MRHGTTTAYRNGCRCPECREANTRAHAAYRSAHRGNIRALDAKYRSAHPDRVRARHAAYRAAHPEVVRARAAAYRAAHLERERARKAAWRASHPGEERARRAAYRAAHPEVVRARAAAYRASHLEQLRAYNAAYVATHPEQVRAYYAVYHSGHPEQVRSSAARHRARIAGAPESERFTLADVIARDGWGCALCGFPVDPLARGRMGKSLDHVIPLARGGSHTLANAQLAHLLCNIRKGARAAPEPVP